MFQSEFTGLKPLQRNTSYIGGFCRFWYIPVEKIATFPRINATNQQLIAEPTLVAGASWFGPIVVPKNEFGYSEDFDRTKAGPYYKYKVEGLHIGDSPESRVNLENMPYHDYLVVGKQRAGGMYLLLGTDQSPLKFDPGYSSGKGPAETAKTKLGFSTDHISKAYILPSFLSDQLAPADGSNGNGGNGTMANQKEIIPFNNVAQVNIPWTNTRNGKFGQMPLIEVWINDGINDPYLFNGGTFEVDQDPPAMTSLTVKFGQPCTGFIVIG